MDDNAIIELFFARSEQAIRELDGKYGKGREGNFSTVCSARTT